MSPALGIMASGYMVPAATDPVFTGGTITDTGGYRIHTFTTSGTLTCVSGSISMDVLVVAGGGSGGRCGSTSILSGGGGAGAVRTGTYTVSSSQTVTVGTGGAAPAASAIGNNGTDSSFGALLVSTGGGGGAGGGTNAAGNNGGSGGGGKGTNTAVTVNGGTGTTGGNNGGSGAGSATATQRRAGGGGGASSVGTSGVLNGQQGNGGNGSSNSYSGSAVTYGAGGGGASAATTVPTGGTGGGGDGGTSSSTTGKNATGIGCGGGGSNGNVAAGAGTNGIVIVRYLYTPPAGGFAPTDLSNLVSWYDASDAATFTFSSGNIVSQWNDKSGSSRHLTQLAPWTGGTARSGTKNSLATVLFGGTPLAYGGSNLITGTSLTAIMVINYTASAQDRALGLSTSVVSDDWGDVRNLEVSLDTGYWPAAYRNSVFLSHPPGSTFMGQWIILTYLFDGTNCTLYVNGTGYTAVGSTGSFDIDNITIGGRWHASTQDMMTGSYVAEFILYGDAKGSTDRTSIWNYLSTKWAI